MNIIELSKIMASYQRAIKHSLLSQMETHLCKWGGGGGGGAIAVLYGTCAQSYQRTAM